MTPGPPPGIDRMQFKHLFPSIRGRAVTPPAYLRRPGPPWMLRDTKCGKVNPELFEYVKDNTGMPDEARAERRYTMAKAMRVCNGADGYDSPCPFRAECKAWGLDQREPGIFGGEFVTDKMIMAHWKAQKEAIRAATEARVPTDESPELAERSG